MGKTRLGVETLEKMALRTELRAKPRFTVHAAEIGAMAIQAPRKCAQPTSDAAQQLRPVWGSGSDLITGGIRP